MKPLLLSVPGQMFEKKVGALLHLVAVHIENFRMNTPRAISPLLDEHQFRVAVPGRVIVPADRGKLEAFVDHVTDPGEHFHAPKLHFNTGKSTTQRIAGGECPWVF